MRKLMVIFIVLFIAFGFAYGKKLTTFKDLGRPGLILVDKDRLFINEGADIYIYSMKDYSLLNKFGKKGEGPQEFMIYHQLKRGGVEIDIQSDTLAINSLGKLSLFTRDGVFQKEFKVPFSPGKYLPLGENFVGVGVKKDNEKDYFTLNIYGPDFKIKKEISSYLGFHAGKYIDPIIITRIPKIYISNKKVIIHDLRGNIHIYDENGSELQKIAQKYDQIEVSKERKKRYDDFFMTDPRYRRLYQQDRDKVKFPDYFPPVRDYSVADNKIYVVTYKEEGTNREIYIFDFNGKLVKKSMYPLQEMNGLELFPYCIANGNLYQLIENLDTEQWELHVTEIK